MRIFLDANILFSAARADGAIRRLLVLLRKEKHMLCVNDYVLEEARRNLTAKASEGLVELDRLLERCQRIPVQPRDLELEGSLPLPEKDRPVLAAAIKASCDALVTGDRAHFGPLFGRFIEGVKIYSPASLAEKLL